MTTQTNIMKCPHCGREYSARACKPLIPQHSWVNRQGETVPVHCPGSGQVPRCAASDKRPLWKDGGVS